MKSAKTKSGAGLLLIFFFFPFESMSPSSQRISAVRLSIMGYVVDLRLKSARVVVRREIMHHAGIQTR